MSSFIKKMKKNSEIYIIAEIGLNHAGNINIAKKLIKDAKEAGANAAKFQIFEPHTLGRDPRNKITAKSRWKKLYTSDKDLLKLIKYCKKNKIDFLCSVFDERSLERVKNLKLKFIKVASSEVNNLSLLKKIKKTKIAPILSTGMSNDNEIRKAVNILKKPKLLHCVSLYPCPPSKVNIKRMIQLKKKYRMTTGFSDHSIGIEACKIAIMNGAEIIEKHFTYNKNIKGSDHIHSCEKKELSELVNFSRDFKSYLGQGTINPSKEEVKTQKKQEKEFTFQKI